MGGRKRKSDSKAGDSKASDSKLDRHFSPSVNSFTLRSSGEECWTAGKTYLGSDSKCASKYGLCGTYAKSALITNEFWVGPSSS